MTRLLLIAAVLTGCTVPYGNATQDGSRVYALPWAVSCDFPAELVPAVRDGFEYWADLSRTQLFEEQPCVPIGGGIAGVLVVAGHQPFDGVVGRESSDGLHAGQIVLFDPWLAGQEWVRRVVIRHEVGHVLGFEHSASPSCLMYPEVSADELCPAELEAIHGVYGEYQ